MVTALFDGRCVICQTTRRMIQALDWFHRVEFLDLHQTAEVGRRYPSLEHQQMMGEIHVIDSQMNISAGFDAVRRMLREVPAGFPLWALLHLPGMRWVGVRIYRWIATNRYVINRLVGVDIAESACKDGVCQIPR